MNEKIGELLFHPSTLITYRNTNIFKVLLYIFILTLLASIVPVIETIKFQGYSNADKTMFETVYKMDFTDIHNFPNCSIAQSKLTCENNREAIEVTSIAGIIKVVIDVENKMNLDMNSYYFRLTEEGVIFSSGNLSYIRWTYDQLPQVWQNVNFEAIKNDPLPEMAYYNVFVFGLNDIKEDLIGYEIIIKIISYYILISFELLFYSFMFYLIIGRKLYKYSEVFKVSVFAYTLPVIIGLFFSLLGTPILNSTILSIITIIYMHIALVPKIPYNPE